jgi:hypothetical protein
MRLVLHPKVYSDIDEIMGYYERVATPGLAKEFYTELRYFMTKVARPRRSIPGRRLLALGLWIIAVKMDTRKTVRAAFGPRSGQRSYPSH